MMTAPKTVIVHVPYQLLPGAKIAPQIRPQKMIEAFRSIGCETIVVAGAPHERRQLTRQVLKQIRGGSLRPDLAYSESAGWPNAFSDGSKRSFHPFLDTRFLARLRRAGIPVGLFYRDAYHRSTDFFEVGGARKLARLVLKFLAERDLSRYNDYLSVLYLPSTEMRKEVPEYQGAVAALPPGATVFPVQSKPSLAARITLLYVGGLGSLYRLHHLVEAVERSPNVQLTICTRESDWMSVRQEYEDLMGARVSIVHRDSSELGPLYDAADIAVLTVEPNAYRDFAVPVKLFEYIGRGKPILATDSTYAGLYVARHDLGWAIPYTVESIVAALDQLSPEGGSMELAGAAARVASYAPSVSWESRAQQVVCDLCALDERNVSGEPTSGS